MRILLQFPEGLKKEALKYAEKYRKEGHEIVLSAAPCYGGCDLALEEAKKTGAEKIIHFGHAPFLKHAAIPVEYVEWSEPVELKNLAEAAKKIKEKKIALATTVQHIHQLEEIKKTFEECGKEVFVSKGAIAVYSGQVLGCDFAAAVHPQAEAAVIIAGGTFHTTGVFVDYPVYSVHPKTGELLDLSAEIGKSRKRRKAAILKALSAKTFGIMVSTKPGQYRLQAAEEIAKKLRARNRSAEIIVASELNASAISNFMFDALVNTACPRIADDGELFGRPIINADAVDELLALMDSTASA